MLSLTLVLLGAWTNVFSALLYWSIVIGLPIGAALLLLRALFRPDRNQS